MPAIAEQTGINRKRNNVPPMGNRDNVMQKTTSNIRTIVLIDDDVWLAKAMEQVLGQNHFIVHVFDNGRRALEFMARERVELVITDIYMDHMDGIEIVRAAKESFPAIKIIAMSGGSAVVDLDCLTVAKMIGADRALTKPIKMPALLKVIGELDAELAVAQPRQGSLKSVAAIKDKPE